MRNKNLILLTSITSLLLTLTPAQALAQESTTPTTSQSFSDKNIGDKCHWKKDIPVPENKYLKLIYDYTYKKYGKEESERNKISKSLQKLVDNGEMTEEEAQYRNLILNDINMKDYFTDYLDWYISIQISPDEIKDIVNKTYDNPDNADEIVKEIIDSYSLKENLEYIDKYIHPDFHAFTSDKELRNKYQKEFDELDKVIEHNEDNNLLWKSKGVEPNFSDYDFKVNKLLDNFDTEEEQVQRYAQLHNWLIMFPLKESVYGDDYTAKGAESISGFKAGQLKELYKILKEKNLDNDDFYSEVNKEFIKTDANKEVSDSYLLFLLKDNYDVDWRKPRSSKFFSYIESYILKPLLFDSSIEIPKNVICEDEETPGDKDTTTPTTTPVEDETETPTATPSTADKEEPDTKTTSKEKPEEPVSEDKEDKEDKENKTTTPEEQVSKENNTVKPSDSIINPKPVQPGFIPVRNNTPVNYSPGVNSNVEPASKEELLADSIKADTGSPTTSIINKIRTIF